MAEKTENKTAGAKLGGFLEKNRKPVIITFVVVLVLVIGFLSVELILSSLAKKDLAKVEGYYYELTALPADTDDSEVTKKATECIENLAAYAKKGGIAGVRANMLSAELAYILKDYEAAISYYEAAIAKGKKSYTAPICYYNVASCYEELNKLTEAAEAYKTAAEFAEFGLAPHAAGVAYSKPPVTTQVLLRLIKLWQTSLLMMNGLSLQIQDLLILKFRVRLNNN